MTAIDELRGISGIIVESDIEVLMYKAILELADNLRTTQVAIEQRDMKIGELEKRVKALEEAHISTSYTYADGAKQLSDHLAKASQPKPSPAPDLEALDGIPDVPGPGLVYPGPDPALVTKFCNQLACSRREQFPDILRAFAAELGVE